MAARRAAGAAMDARGSVVLLSAPPGLLLTLRLPRLPSSRSSPALQPGRGAPSCGCAAAETWQRRPAMRSGAARFSLCCQLLYQLYSHSQISKLCAITTTLLNQRNQNRSIFWMTGHTNSDGGLGLTGFCYSGPLNVVFGRTTDGSIDL